ncbi:potassium channel family protein [Microbacterium sp. CPCC 204701]|uniref:potassium channel family protein n=1 Tax=Microbacterium sp. CPCC 204701 TaxID=2493084 RepID=UPI0013E3BA2B|nr:potassium channel family protein [Microbacterium sp. CPCC 204701]
MNEATWRRRTEIPLMIASLVYLIVYSWRVIADPAGPAHAVASIVVLVTWAMFIVDYFVRLLMAEHRMVWFRTHLQDLAFALMPVLRLVRLLGFLTMLPGVRSTAGDRLRVRIMVYSIGAAVILIYIASLAELEVERHAPGAGITSFGIALWWACVTVTTTGYGDYVPVTDAGRAVAAALMFGGVALAGIITASLASWVLERAAGGSEAHEPATRAQMRTLMTKIDALAAAPASPDTGGSRGVGGGTGEPRHEADVEGWEDLGNGGDDRPGG